MNKKWILCFARLLQQPRISSYDKYSFLTKCEPRMTQLKKSAFVRYFGTTSALSTRNDRCKKPRNTDTTVEDDVVKKYKDDTEIQDFLRELRKDFGQTKETNENDDKTDSNRKKPKDNIPKSLQDRFVIYRDEDAEVVLDANEIEQLNIEKSNATVELLEDESSFSVYQQRKQKDLSGYNLKRGKRGVFEVEELVSVLREENARDICVIEVAPELHYVDYLIIVSAISARHVKAIAEFVRKLHKSKKSKKDPYVPVEGEKCADWKAIDMGNLVLHIFLPETRRKYDLETLWTVGKKYDDLVQHAPENDIMNSLENYSKFLENLKPLENDSQPVQQ